MLNKRTQILLSQDLWENLTSLAEDEGTSVGQLVRLAVEKSYFNNGVNDKAKRAIEKIMVIRPKAFRGRINYESLIEYGRKI